MDLPAELWRADAADLAAAIATRAVSSREVIDAHLDRIRAVDPQVNAVTVVLEERARADADAADARVAEGGDLPPLLGVPFTVKENIDLAGSPTTHGIAALADAVPTVDAPTVARMRAAGAVPIGRTNMPELGLRVSTENPMRGTTLNPWDPALTAGGSSGGEAAAHALGMSPLGLGNDLGGSVRNPAYCCGTVSLKPTHGRVPAATVLEPADPGLAVRDMMTNGPMARSVADVRLGFEILDGRDPRDPGSVSLRPHPGRSTDRPLRIGVIDAADALVPVEPEVDRAVVDVVDRMQRTGAVVESVTLDLSGMVDAWAALLAQSLDPAVPLYETILSADSMFSIHRFVDHGRSLGLGVDAAIMERGRLGRAWSAAFTDLDAVVCPVWPMRPPPHGFDIDPSIEIAENLRRLSYIVPGNLLGVPAAVVPTGVVGGLPTSVQIYGDLGTDELVLDIAAEIEAEADAVMAFDGAAHPTGVDA